jgi:hypothetical protein
VLAHEKGFERERLFERRGGESILGLTDFSMIFNRLVGESGGILNDYD